MTAFLFLACAAASFAIIAGAVKITWKMESTVTEDLPAASVPFAESTKSQIVHTGLNVSKALTASSAAGTNTTGVAQGTVTMTAGAATLNLAAAPGSSGTVDLTGLKLRTFIIRASSENANPITIAKGASNGYTGLGAAFSITLDPGKSMALEPNATAVAAGVRTLDVSGTGAQELDFIATAGAN